MMHLLLFTNPGYLAILAVSIPLLVYFWRKKNRRTRASLILRITSATLIVIALSGIQIAMGKRPYATIFVLDRSESIAPIDKSGVLDSINQIASNFPGGENGVVVFAKEAVIEQPLKKGAGISEIQSTPQAAGTDISKGLMLARAMLESRPESSKRIVLLSDGNQTSGDALKEAAVSAMQGTPIDVMPLATAAESSGRSVFLVDCRGPDTVRLDEPFEIEISIRGGKGSSANLQILRDGASIATKRERLSGDLETYKVPDRTSVPGFHQYQIKLENADKSKSFDRDEGGTIIYAYGRTQVLHLSERPAGFLDSILKRQGFNVVSSSPQSAPKTVRDLAPYDLIVLDNVPAAAFSEDQMHALQEHVEKYGGGLMMVGGSGSFGPGGYSGTPVEQVLPVEMALRNREKKPALALVLVLDKSGSMGMEQRKISKLDMAKEAVLRLSDLLSPGDSLGIIAFDRNAKDVMQLGQAMDRSSVNNYLQAITAGGGTSILPAVERAYKWLDSSPAEKKHILLLSDGQADQSERQPLLAKVAGSSVVLSTVGIGSDADRGLLQKLAENAHGRAYFSDTGTDLPEIFKREGMLISGKWLIEHPFVPRISAEHEILRSLGNESIPEMTGYVAVTPKKLTEIPLTAENNDPLLVCSQYGLGKTLAFTSDFSSTWTRRLVQWNRFSGLWTQMARWASRSAQSGTLHGDVKVEDDTAVVTVDAFDDSGNLLNYGSLDAQLETPDSKVHDLAMTQTFSGKYECRFPLTARGSYLLTVTPKGNSGALHLGFDFSKLPEDTGLEPNQAFLRQIAQAGHGSVLDTNSLPRTEPAAPGYKDIWPAAAILSLLFFLADLLFCRRQSIR